VSVQRVQRLAWFTVRALNLSSVSTAWRINKIEKKTNFVVLVRKRTIRTERPSLVGEFSANFLQIEGVPLSAQQILYSRIHGFLGRSR
jgi:hypothetical protein